MAGACGYLDRRVGPRASVATAVGAGVCDSLSITPSPFPDGPSVVPSRSKGRLADQTQSWEERLGSGTVTVTRCYRLERSEGPRPFRASPDAHRLAQVAEQACSGVEPDDVPDPAIGHRLVHRHARSRPRWAGQAPLAPSLQDEHVEAPDVDAHGEGPCHPAGRRRGLRRWFDAGAARRRSCPARFHGGVTTGSVTGWFCDRMPGTPPARRLAPHWSSVR